MPLGLGKSTELDMEDQPNVEGKVRFSKSRLSTLQIPVDDDDDDDFSDSLDALMRRRSDSGRRRSIRRSPKKGSLTLGLDPDGKPRRRSSTMTSGSCEETQISIEEPEMTEEQIFESIKVHRELIDGLKKQPWKMKKRLKIVRRAKAYVKKHEGELEARLAHSKNTKDIMARYTIIFERYWERLKREAGNVAKNLVPWEMRIKRIESHFGSVVSSYFTFLRWLFWVNIVMIFVITTFVIVPEYFGADRKAPYGRKELMEEEVATAYNLQQLFDFEGFVKYSPLFYGYYNSAEKTRHGYRIPLAYFMTLMGVYGYSFYVILRRMAHNTRLSKLTDKDEDCTFTWKLYTGWDYMIGNSETADNKVASLIMSFKENILEERERKKEDRNWKIFGLRLLANLMVLLLLVSSALAVIKVVERSREADETWWRQNEVTVVVSLLSTIIPNLFDVIGTIEHNHPRIQLRWQLGRIMVLYLLNLYSLIFALFSKADDINCHLRNSAKPDQLTKKNRILKPPNATDTQMLLSTTDPSSVFATDKFDPSDDGFSGFNLEGNFSLLTNMSEEARLPMPRYYLLALLLSLNATFKLHHIWLNSTCVMVKVFCDTRVPVAINGSHWMPSESPPTMYPMLEPDGWSTPFANSSDFNHDQEMSLRNLSESANLTEAMESLTSLSLRMDESGQPLRSSTSREAIGTRGSNRGVSYVEISVRGKGSGLVSNDGSQRTNLWVFINPTRLSFVTPNSSTDANSEGAGAEAIDDLSSSTYTSDWNATTMNGDSSTPFPLEDFDIPLESEDESCTEIKCIDTLELASATTTMLYNTEENTSALATTTNVATDNASDPGATTNKDGITLATQKQLRELCWETEFGQELVKLTIMDTLTTLGSIIVTDFIRALFVRIMNHCWCWDLEKQFPGYGDFKIAENILHLVNNQGMIWMGMFFSPGIPAVNMVKLVIILYVRSWSVLTCNVPHETVFKASRSNNFYYALLLTMLFLCTLPVGYAVVWLEPSWHCGPFSGKEKIYHIITESLKAFLPEMAIRALEYAASPGIVIPLLVLLILVIYYLSSVANSLREANKDLKLQLRRERTEERRKVFQMADTRHDPPKVASKWGLTKKILPVLPSSTDGGALKQSNSATDDAAKPPAKSPFGGSSAFANVIGAALKAKAKELQ